MRQIPISQREHMDLPAYEPRCFVPEKACLTDAAQVKDLFQRLIQREVLSQEDFQKWIFDRSELEAALDQQEAVLYIRMTAQTDDLKKAEEYKQFVKDVEPVMRSMDHALNRRYIELKKDSPLNDPFYEVYDRAIESNLEIFREKNVELMTKTSLLSQEYQAICGAMTVNFNGRERTLAQMAKFLFEPDPSLRESAWRAITKRRLQDRDRLDDLFDQMLELRARIARNAGKQNYCDYQFQAKHRFDYTPEDCRQYHRTVQEEVVPVWKNILERRRIKMNLSRLKPWDLNVDPLGRPPLKPFFEVDQFIEGVERMFAQTDPILGEQFRNMTEMGLLDLVNHKGKAPGGYQSTLAEARLPFIFMNAVGIDGDVKTLLHEGGHAFHVLACAPQPIYDYRHAPMEFNEVASMGMELLAGEHMHEFYGDDDRVRSWESHLEDVVFTFVWVALIDAFQHWIYEHPDHDRKQRTKHWLELYDRFGGRFIDWRGLSREKAASWHKQLHIFEAPFYYIEYGIAQIGALQLWLNAKKDKRESIKAYKAALSLGGSRPLPELFKQAGLNFDFSRETIRPLMQAVEEELKTISG